MKWAVGVTAVESRRDTTLPPSLEAISRAGFPSPTVRFDSEPRLGCYGNWVLLAHELTIRYPDADVYAVFQDDVDLSLGVRQYVEDSLPRLPYRCYLNLITYPSEDPGQFEVGVGLGFSGGWYASRQRGRGAQGLVFPCRIMLELLCSPRFVLRRMDTSLDSRGRPKGTRNLDGGIVDAMTEAGVTEMIHWPSLITHDCDAPSAVLNGRQPAIRSWRGRDYDFTTGQT